METRARRDFLKIHPQVRERLADALDDLQASPRPPGAKRMVGRDGYRVRVGDYRVLYAVDDKARVVRVYVIGHRRDVYRKR
ncbi:MAG: type II toxin-antitoxin system RelE/ParE family toxin [Planctomycetes bacterium]|nr:type II toxin-antitoxin system RelE/ParE family toxin [Planctomycetota bacterium]